MAWINGFLMRAEEEYAYNKVQIILQTYMSLDGQVWTVRRNVKGHGNHHPNTGAAASRLAFYIIESDGNGC